VFENELEFDLDLTSLRESNLLSLLIEVVEMLSISSLWLEAFNDPGIMSKELSGIY
jgi:hypothetical protein